MKTQSIILAAILATGATAVTAQTVDGTLGVSEYPAAIATQSVDTDFGDNSDSNLKGANGSELDALYVTNNATHLFVLLTGNAQTNGNQIAILFGVNGAANGVTTIPGGGFDSLRELTVPTPVHFGITPNAGNGATQDLFMNLHRYTTGTQQSHFLGQANGDANTGTATIGTITADVSGSWSFSGANAAAFPVALNNSNTGGVAGGTGSTGGTPGTVTTGLEVAVPLAFFQEIKGSALANGDVINIIAAVVGSDGRFLSNQLLPALAAPAGNLGASDGGDGVGGNPGVTLSLSAAGAGYTLSGIPSSVADWQLLD